MTEKLKTGTTTLGVVYKDGVLLAADKRATAGHYVSMRDVQKVIPINERMVLTIAGSVSDAQLFVKYIKAETRLNRLRLNRHNTAQEVANLIGNILYRGIRSMGSITHFLFAARNNDGTYGLYDIYPDGSVTEIKQFGTSGSGSVFADGVLETNYKPDMDNAAAIRMAKQALNAALQKDSASGNGADIFTLTQEGVKKVETIVVNTGITVE